MKPCLSLKVLFLIGVKDKVEKVWFKNYEPGVPHEINIDVYDSLVEVFEQSFEKYKELPCFKNMGRAITYGQLDKLSQDFAAFLTNTWGCKKGDRIVIMLPNILQYPVVMLGALRAGLIVVNLNPLYTPREVIHVLKDSEAKKLVVLENFAHTIDKVLQKEPDLKVDVMLTQIGDLLGLKGFLVNFVVKYIKKMVPAYTLPSAIWFKSAIKQGKGAKFEKPQLTHQDIAYLQYTGGTTGVPKGAMLTHGNMIANVLQASAWLVNRLSKKYKGGIITALPLYHIFSLTANCLTFMCSGLTNVLITNPKDIKGFIKELKAEPFSFMTGVNTLFNALLHDPDFKTVDFSSFVFTLGGGMSVQESVARRWKEVTGVPLIEAYGLTEASPAVSIGPMNLKDFNHTVGLPVPSTDIKICDTQGRELGFNEPGELCVKGPQIMLGYWRDPKGTEEVLDKEGWLKTGDIATVDTEGYIKIVDRKKDLILVSGFNVYPNEVEAVLSSMPGIKEVAVLGVPDEVQGERVKAFVVLSDPQDKSITAQKIIVFCKQQLTNYKVPKEIEFRDELPKTQVGKILRRALKE